MGMNGLLARCAGGLGPILADRGAAAPTDPEVTRGYDATLGWCCRGEARVVGLSTPADERAWCRTRESQGETRALPGDDPVQRLTHGDRAGGQRQPHAAGPDRGIEVAPGRDRDAGVLQQRGRVLTRVGEALETVTELGPVVEGAVSGSGRAPAEGGRLLQQHLPG